MTETQEQPKQQNLEETIISQIGSFFSEAIPEDLKPKPLYLQRWFQLFHKLDLNSDKTRLIEKEFTIAHVLKQAYLDNQNREVNLDNEKLTYGGIDPAKLVRYLILQASYPSGIEFDNQKFTLILEPNIIKRLTEAIRVIPGYDKLNEKGLEDIIKGIGFEDNEAGGNYVLRLNNEEFIQFLKKIAHTQGVLPSKR